MNKHKCQWESQVLASSRTGAWTEDTRQHLQACAACSDAMRVDHLLQGEAARVPELDQLPDPTVVWWRARQRARLRQIERAKPPTRFAERFALVLGAIGMAIGMSLAWPLIRITLARWTGVWSSSLLRALPSDDLSLILALFCSLLLLIGFALYSQSAEG